MNYKIIHLLILYMKQKLYSNWYPSYHKYQRKPQPEFIFYFLFLMIRNTLKVWGLPLAMVPLDRRYIHHSCVYTWYLGLYVLNTSVFNAENLPFYVSETLVAYANLCLRKPNVSLCLRTQTMGFLWPLFFKKRFVLIKSYIFHFNTSQVNLTYDWALNQP